MKKKTKQVITVIQYLMRAGFIVAVAVFVGVAGDTAAEVVELQNDIKQGNCVPTDLPKANPEDLPEDFQGFEINKSSRSPSSTSSSPAS